MSDRKVIISLSLENNLSGIDLFMDGETGTWRLFLKAHGGRHDNVDFSIDELRELSRRLQSEIEKIETSPHRFNAELRRSEFFK